MVGMFCPLLVVVALHLRSQLLLHKTPHLQGGFPCSLLVLEEGELIAQGFVGLLEAIT